MSLIAHPALFRKPQVFRPHVTDFRRWLPTLALILVLAAGAFFRIHDIGKECFDCDELYAVRIHGLSPHSLGTVLARDSFHTNHPPLMTVPYLFWTAFFGTGETAVRMLPFLLGLAAILLTYSTGFALGGARVGLLAAALLAVNPLHIAYSQEARHYSMLVALVAAAHLLFLRCLREGRARDRAGYLAVSFLALFTHYFAVVALAPHALIAAWVVWRDDGPARRNAIQALLTLVLAIIPFVSWLPIMRYQMTIPWEHLQAGSPGTVLSSAAEVAGLGKGAAVVAAGTAFLLLIAVGLRANRFRPILAREGGTKPPLPRQIGIALLEVGPIAAAISCWAIPAYVFPPARQMLAAYGYDPATTAKELHLLLLLCITFPLTLAVVGLVVILWPRLVELAERLPHAPASRPLSVAGFVAALLIIPFVVIHAVSLLGVPFVQARNLLVLTPVFAVALALGLARVNWLVGAAAVVCLAVGLFQYEPLAGPLGNNGRLMGMHTTAAWRDLESELVRQGKDHQPLVAAQTPATDPLLFYLAARRPVRIRAESDAALADLPAHFIFIHYNGDTYSTELFNKWQTQGRQLKEVSKLDRLILIDVELPPGSQRPQTEVCGQGCPRPVR